MMLNDIFVTIESDEFFAEMSIASDAKSFIRYARGKGVVSALLEHLDDVTEQKKVSRRVDKLLGRKYDVAYVRPVDTALAIYIWALGIARSPYFPLVAAKIINASDTWWAGIIAKSMLVNFEMPVDSDSKSMVITLDEKPDVESIADSFSVSSAASNYLKMIYWLDANITEELVALTFPFYSTLLHPRMDKVISHANFLATDITKTTAFPMRGHQGEENYYDLNLVSTNNSITMKIL